jgi:UDP-N-acetylglucosamine 1-carboxyvinyltransferase
MDKILIEGGVPLKGTVTLSGAKNAALPILAATLLAPGHHHIGNIPRLRDIRTIKALLSHLGLRMEGEGEVSIDSRTLTSHLAPYDLVKTMRASILVLGPLLARLGRAEVSLPGGCAIGARPVNLHIEGLTKMGVSFTLEHGYILGNVKKLKGARITFDLPTVTGTENLMMAAVLAEGETVIRNAAMEPEVGDLARFLTAMGADISGVDTENLTIRGVPALNPVPYRIIPDRIEAGTFMVAAGITGGDLTILGYDGRFNEALQSKLTGAGLTFSQGKKGLRVKGPSRPKPVNVKTLPYPGFPTDMQAQFMTLMSLAEGSSLITETIFENRFMHVNELVRMGADISISGSTAQVKGVNHLIGAPVMATDLRASASLILAGLAARNTTEVSRVYHIDRGYERIEEKLTGLGARIRRVKET